MAVLLDEVHERALEADLAMALCLDLQRVLRPELRLLAMSATLDGARLSALLDAPVIESAGRMFPVDIRHLGRDVMDPRNLPDAMARAVRTALLDHEGDILAFLPGMGEIRRTQDRAGRDAMRAGAAAAWRSAACGSRTWRCAPQTGRRVVLATSDCRNLADGARRSHRHRWRLASLATRASIRPAA